MQNPGFRADDELPVRRFAHETENSAGAERFIRLRHDFRTAFRMHQDFCLRMHPARLADHFHGHFIVRRAESLPELHGAVQLVHHVCTEIAVRQEHDFFVRGNGADDFFRIAGCADIDLRLDFGGAVYIRHENRVRIRLFVCGDFRRVRHIRHRTAGIEIGQENGGVRREQFCGFRHETDSAENDDPCLEFFGFDAQFKGIAREIGNVLNIAGDIIVGEYDGIALLAQCRNFFCKCQHGSFPCIVYGFPVIYSLKRKLKAVFYISRLFR